MDLKLYRFNELKLLKILFSYQQINYQIKQIQNNS